MPQEAFSTRHDREAEKQEMLRDTLYREIGQLKVELDWLKKIWTAQQSRNGQWLTLDVKRSALRDSAAWLG